MRRLFFSLVFLPPHPLLRTLVPSRQRQKAHHRGLPCLAEARQLAHRHAHYPWRQRLRQSAQGPKGPSQRDLIRTGLWQEKQAWQTSCASSFFSFFSRALNLHPTVVPKALRKALSLLATEEQVNLLVLSLKEELALFDPNAESDDPLYPDHDLDLDRTPEIAWTEGVEEYKDTPPEELWAMLGRPEASIPFFNPKQDPENRHDPWTPEGLEWLRNPSNGVPLALRWHQLVGVLKMVENAFSRKPVLLMDGVGLGKTIQVSAFIAVLAWYREYFAVHGKFPGKFGAHPFFRPGIVSQLTGSPPS